MLPIFIKHNTFRNLDCNDFRHHFETVAPRVHLMEDREIRERKISYFWNNKKITNSKIWEAWIEKKKNNTFHDENKIYVESFFLKVQDIPEKYFHFVGAQELALPGMLSCTLTTQELLDKLKWLKSCEFKLTNQKNPATFRDMPLI